MNIQKIQQTHPVHTVAIAESAPTSRLPKLSEGFGGRSLRTGIRRRFIMLISLAVTAAIAVGALAAAAPAGATVTALSSGPTFECTGNMIFVDQIKLNDNVGSVRVQAEVEVWTGTQWVVAVRSAIATVDTDQAFASLYAPTFSFNAANNRYFEVFIYTSINGGTVYHYPAQALRDHYSTYVCHTV